MDTARKVTFSVIRVHVIHRGTLEASSRSECCTEREVNFEINSPGLKFYSKVGSLPTAQKAGSEYTAYDQDLRASYRGKKGTPPLQQKTS